MGRNRDRCMHPASPTLPGNCHVHHLQVTTAIRNKIFIMIISKVELEGCDICHPGYISTASLRKPIRCELSTEPFHSGAALSVCDVPFTCARYASLSRTDFTALSH